MKAQAAEVNRDTRSTGKGAYDDSFLYSLRQRRELEPHRRESSRTGNHGSKTWFLLPGRYFEVSASFSNSGNGGWRVGALTINDQLQESFVPVATNQIPDWLKELLPAEALAEVAPEPYE